MICINFKKRAKVAFSFFKKLKPGFWLVLILILALFLRLYFFVGLNFSDDQSYVHYASKIFQKDFNPTDNNGLRMGIYYPVGIFYLLFGINPISAVLYQLISSLITIAVIFYIGKLLFNEKVGLLAAFFLSFFPLDVLYSTQTMGETPLALFTALSVFFFLKGERSRRNKIYFYLSGISIGISYLIRESGLIPLLFLFGYFLYTRKLKLNYTFIFLGLLSIFLFEGIHYAIDNGDFFLRFHEVSGHYGAENAVKKLGLNVNMDFYPKVMFNLDSSYHFIKSQKYSVEYGLFYYVVVLSAIFLLFRRKRESNILLIWFFSFFLYLQFGTMSFTEYAPIHRLARHLCVITVPSVLIISVFLNRIFIGKNRLIKILRHTSILIISCFLFFSSIYFIYYTHDYLKESTLDIKDIHLFLKDKLDKKIYADTGIAAHLRFLFKFEKDDTIQVLTSSTKLEELKDSYIVIDGTRGIFENPRFESKYLSQPLENWKLIKTLSNANKYVYGRFDPKIYYVP